MTAEELKKENFFISFVCHWDEGKWKCGCKDKACAQPSWNVQMFTSNDPLAKENNPATGRTPNPKPTTKCIPCKGPNCSGVCTFEGSLGQLPTAKPISNNLPGRTVGGCSIVNGQKTCWICLALHTMIDTPTGPVAVEDLTQGVEVWTVTKSGKRIRTAVEKVNRTAVPHNHQVVHLLLADGRELWASPGHPTGEGATIGELKSGDLLDGIPVKEATLVPYTSEYTYDLLPAGDTGKYWANGILIGSTLK